MSTGSNFVWIGLGLVGFAFLAPSLRKADVMPPANMSAQDSDAAGQFADEGGKPGAGSAGNGFASRDLVRSPDGHFYADAQVNGAQVHFMIDTGASMVALTPADAQRAGIALPTERAHAMSAGGEVEVIPVTVDRIAIGPLEARDVRGAVASQLPVSLLGQSFLSQIGSVEIRGDRMTLR
jgi:aspartyl protease family protein